MHGGQRFQVVEQPSSFAAGLVERAGLRQSANLHKDQRGYAELSQKTSVGAGGYKNQY